jgi:hypothetical protein
LHKNDRTKHDERKRLTRIMISPIASVLYLVLFDGAWRRLACSLRRGLDSWDWDIFAREEVVGRKEACHDQDRFGVDRRTTRQRIYMKKGLPFVYICRVLATRKARRP